MNLRTIYYEQIAIPGSTGPGHLILPFEPSLIQSIIITVENDLAVRANSLRFRCDGVNAAADTGVPMAVGDTREIADINDIINFSYVNTESTETLLHVEYFGTDNN